MAQDGLGLRLPERWTHVKYAGHCPPLVWDVLDGRLGLRGGARNFGGFADPEPVALESLNNGNKVLELRWLD